MRTGFNELTRNEMIARRLWSKSEARAVRAWGVAILLLAVAALVAVVLAGCDPNTGDWPVGIDGSVDVSADG